MKYNVDNDYGCTKSNGISDMDNADVMATQLKKAGIQYECTELTFGTMTAEPAHLIHYTGSKSGNPVTVLVVPAAGADSWAEQYYHFPGMTKAEAIELNWSEVYEHVHGVWWQNVIANVQVAQYCPTCHKAPVDTYQDLRGQKRCQTCHTHTADNKADFWK